MALKKYVRRRTPLNHCCWCFLLKAGAMFIGVADILRGTVYMVYGTEMAMKKIFLHKYVLHMGITMAVVGGISPVFGIILLLAAIYERPKLLVLTMFHSVCFIFVNLVIGMWFSVYKIKIHKISTAIFGIFTVLILSAWEVYSLIVVYSYYVELTKIRESKLELRRISSIYREQRSRIKEENLQKKKKKEKRHKEHKFLEPLKEGGSSASVPDRSDRKDFESSDDNGDDEIYELAEI